MSFTVNLVQVQSHISLRQNVSLSEMWCGQFPPSRNMPSALTQRFLPAEWCLPQQVERLAALKDEPELNKDWRHGGFGWSCYCRADDPQGLLRDQRHLHRQLDFQALLQVEHSHLRFQQVPQTNSNQQLIPNNHFQCVRHPCAILWQTHSLRRGSLIKWSRRRCLE